MPGGGARITSDDRGFRALLRRITSQGQPEVTVGVHESDGAKDHGDDVTVIDVASFHEFGTQDIPPRSFIRGWADENEQANAERLRKIAQAIVKGQLQSTEQGLERFGNFAVGDIQKRIRDRIPPPLAEETIERKGSSVPLIDTGQLRSSITYRVGKR